MSRVSYWVATIGYLFVVLAVLVTIVVRFTGGGWIWVQDSIQLSYSWVYWLSILLASVANRHFKIDLVERRIGIEARRVYQLILVVVTAVFNAIILFFGFRLAVGSLAEYYAFMPRVSVFWEVLAIPVVFAVMLVPFVPQTVRWIQRQPVAMDKYE